MTRCTSGHQDVTPPGGVNRTRRKLTAWAALLAVGTLGVVPAAHAQVWRQLPPQALSGTLTITQPPLVELDGRPTRLAPGARIRDTANRYVTPVSLMGQALAVRYTRDSLGQMLLIWVLTPDEQLADPTPRDNIRFESMAPAAGGAAGGDTLR